MLWEVILVEKQDKRHRSTLRVLEVFNLLTGNEQGLTLTEISETLTVPKSSLLPILHTMKDEDYLEFDDYTKKYKVGLQSYLLSNSYLKNNQELGLIFSEMKDIVEKCQETCQLGKLAGNQVLYIGKEESPQTIRLVSDIGKSLPAYCTAIGKALISDLSMEALDKLFPEALEKHTSNTITTINVLYNEIQKFKDKELYYDHEEIIENVECIATNIRKDGKIIYGIGVSVPSFRFSPEKQRQIEELLLIAKHRIEVFI